MKLPISPGRYLITGAAGFVGSHLTETLLEAGYEVVGIDNFITGRPQNIKPFLGNRNFEFIEQDIIKPIKIDGALAGILHFASPASPIDYQKYPIETLHVGSTGTDNVMLVAEKCKCPVLVASTSEVYGDPKEHPQKETYWGNVNPIGPRGCYDESKRYMEALTMAYHRTRGVDTRIIRIFNTYGPRMRGDDGRVVPNFCYQALANEDLTIYGDGSQTRSFCYVEDLVRGILLVLAHEGDHDPFNLGFPRELSILEFGQKILALSGATSKLAYRDLPKDDPKLRKPDITRAKEVLGWEPTIDIDEGLARTFEYYKQQRAQA